MVFLHTTHSLPFSVTTYSFKRAPFHHLHFSFLFGASHKNSIILFLSAHVFSYFPFLTSRPSLLRRSSTSAVLLVHTLKIGHSPCLPLRYVFRFHSYASTHARVLPQSRCLLKNIEHNSAISFHPTPVTSIVTHTGAGGGAF